MKKLILFLNFFFASLIVLFGSSIFAHQVNAQTKEPIGCEELKSILGSKECPTYIMKIENRSLWCAQSIDQLVASSEEGATIELFKGRTPDYLLDSSLETQQGLESCYGETSEGKNEIGQPKVQTAPSGFSPYNFARSIIAMATDPKWLENIVNVEAGMSGAPGPQTPASMNVEALMDKVPTGNDLIPIALPEKTKKSPLTAVITELSGSADIRLADGTWVGLEKGNLVPNDATIYSGFDSNVTIQFPDHVVIVLRSLDELNVRQFETDASVYRRELKLETGELRFKVEEGKMETDMKVSTPNASASISGTDVGVYYNKETGTSIWEIYDGTIEVKNNSTGEKKTISSSYGFPIKRLEVTKDGPMVEKTAIPKSQKSSRIPLWMYLVGATTLGIGVILFVRKRFALKGRGKKR